MRFYIIEFIQLRIRLNFYTYFWYTDVRMLKQIEVQKPTIHKLRKIEPKLGY